MPENPLLPNAQLRALHALLSQTLELQKDLPRAKKKSGTLPSSAFTPLPRREALLAGTLLQLCSGDILIPEPQDTLTISLARKRMSKGRSLSVLDLSPGSPQLTLAGALGTALKHSGDRLTLMLTRSGVVEDGWQETLATTEERKLPLVLVCADPSGQGAFRATPPLTGNGAPLTWTTFQRFATKIHLPILSVDGEDAVAVYRVTQESILRARSGGGPAVIWAMLPTQAEVADRAKASLPLRRLERYLHARRIAL